MSFPIRSRTLGRAARRPWTSAPGRLGAAVLRWRLRQNTRRALARLDDQRLADVGLSPAERDREAAKPFWIP